MNHLLLGFCYGLLAFLFTGCADYAYLQQSVYGHFDVLKKREPIAEIINDPTTRPALKKHFSSLLAIRDFATDTLGLPDNESYRSYADIGRPFVVYNVVAAAEFSLRPQTWCYPVVGCLPYRGFYRRSDAKRVAIQLQRKGYDVNVYGVPAYSTLRWFNDPVLSTFSMESPQKFAALVFHELAHQIVYLPHDSQFNEAFAVTVEQEGVKRYLEQQGDRLGRDLYLKKKAEHQAVLQRLRETRAKLDRLYQTDLPYRQKRAEKRLIFRQLQGQFNHLRPQFGQILEPEHYRPRRFNNANLVSVSTYYKLVPGFRALFQQEEQNFKRFYAAVNQIAQRSRSERHHLLNVLAHRPSTPWRTILPAQSPPGSKGAEAVQRFFYLSR